MWVQKKGEIFLKYDDWFFLQNISEILYSQIKVLTQQLVKIRTPYIAYL